MTVLLKVKVVPGASRSEIAGWLGDTLKIRVSAPPEKGKANKAILELLCEVLAVPVSEITIKSGSASAHKVLEVRGLNPAQLNQRLTVQAEKKR